MTKEEVLEFVTKNPMFSLATTDGSQPHARMMMICRAETVHPALTKAKFFSFLWKQESRSTTMDSRFRGNDKM